MKYVPLGSLYAHRVTSIDPRAFPSETFELWSIPAFDAGQPDIAEGSTIGSAKKCVEPNDVILSRIVPHIRRAAVVAKSQGYRQIASSEWIIFRSRKFWPSYLKHFLISNQFHDQFMNTVAGVGGSLVRARADAVSEIVIPLLPLSEQRRNAAILDEVDDLRRKRRLALERLDELSQAVFREMFGALEINSKKWKAGCTLGEVSEIASGVTKGRKVNGQATRLVPYVTVLNVQDRALNLTVVKTIEATDSEIRRYRLQRNDLLLTEGGDRDKLGRGTLWNDDLPECIHQNHIFRVRLISDKLNPVFLNWLVGSPFGKRYFLRSAKQTTGIASINATQLRNFPLIIPPRPLQDDFAAQIDAIAALKTTARRSKITLEALFASLQHRIFAGNIDPYTVEANLTLV